jgi:L-asparagine transporter-like permease
MYIVPIAWLYVALMMAVAEATHSNGTVLGAIITFVMYGLAPMGLVMYVMGAPVRRRAIKAREAAELAAAHSTAPDTSSQAATDAVPPVGEKP